MAKARANLGWRSGKSLRRLFLGFAWIVISGIFLASTIACSEQPSGDADEGPMQVQASEAPDMKIQTACSVGPCSAISLANGSGLSSGSDLDGDGISDYEEQLMGTDPKNRDTDGDALPDDWEIRGLPDLCLPAIGADPKRKDVFVEMDYMPGFKPDSGVLDTLIQVFKEAPVNIALHLCLDDELTHDRELTTDEFIVLRKANFNAARQRVFHYMIWADRQDGSSSSGWSFPIEEPRACPGSAVFPPGQDFLLTLGEWDNSDKEKIGTFLHELGHNLGLSHGGSDSLVGKPNHFSVMNKMWQRRGLRRAAALKFDYQRFRAEALNERDLDEPDGVKGDAEIAGGKYQTLYRHKAMTIGPVPAWKPIDWNLDTDTTDRGLSCNIDLVSDLENLKATPNEWETLCFSGGFIGAVGAARNFVFADSPPELTLEEDRLFRPSRQD